MEHLYTVTLLIIVFCFFKHTRGNKTVKSTAAPEQLNIDGYFPVKLSRYTASGCLVKSGQRIIDHLDKFRIRLIEEKDLNYFSNCGASMLNEYLILLTDSEFKSFIDNQIKKQNHGRL